MLFIAATTFTLTSCSCTDRFRCGRSRSAKISCAIETVDLRRLVVSASPAPRSAARESSAATKTIAATGFLLAGFVDLKLTAFDIQTVKFSNGSCRVISRPEFDESETSGTARFPFGDNAGGGRPIDLLGEQLQQALIGHAKRKISYIEFCHLRSSVGLIDLCGWMQLRGT